MSSEHHEVFVRESEEQITELNNALLRLESDPDDREAMDAIFRTAHTLKGNAGAMGFDGISGLAHAIEDLLDEIRNGVVEVDPEVMDLVFAGVDDIDASLDHLEASGEVTLDHGDVVDDIRAIIDDRTGAGGEPDAAGDDAAGDDDAGVDDEVVRVTESILDGVTAELDGALHAAVSIDGTDMRGVDAMLALESVVDEWDVLGTHPDREAVEDGEFREGFELVVAGTAPDDLAATLDATGQIADFEVTAVPRAVPETDGHDTDDPAANDSGGSGEPWTGDQRGDSSNGETATGGDATGDDDGDATADDDGDATGDGDGDASAEADGDVTAEADGDVTADAGPTADTDDSADGAGGTDGDGPDGPGDDSGRSRSKSASVDDIKSVRVDVGQLDDLHGLVEQLVTSRIKLRRAVEVEETGDALDNLDELDKITTHLQDTVMDMRLIPLKKVVSKFPRLVRDLAREEDKRIDFAIEGEDIELDRTILTQISDPLMHILRNSVDHGIEPPAEREAAGKAPEGRIELRADRERDHVIIEVEDDGRGLDVDAIREKAVEKGVHSETELEAMEDSDVYDLIFHPGFSTSDEVTDVSGRGVGMDVVHSTVKQLDGSVNVESESGEGTTVRLRLPVTVAIVTVLFVRVDDQRYGIPIKAIDEISRAKNVRTINGQEVIEHGDDIYPVIELGKSLDVGAATADGGTVTDDVAGDDTAADDATVGVGADDGMLLRIRKSERQVALYCDAVEDQEEVVVKPLEGVLSGIPGLSGTAVLGDGNIVPILDVVTL